PGGPKIGFEVTSGGHVWRRVSGAAHGVPFGPTGPHSVGETMQEAKLEARFQMWVARGGRVRLEPTERRVRARLGGITVADSRRAQLLYLPPPLNASAFRRADVRRVRLHESGIASTMPAVGEGKQWTVGGGGEVGEGVVG